MLSSILTALYLIFPVMIAAVMHMFVIKLTLAMPLTKPINQRLFGSNKTWRGLVVMPLFGIVGLVICMAVFPRQDLLEVHYQEPYFLGLALGFSYVLFELPNSFLKRRLGIPPGASATRYRSFFFLLDHLDSATGCCLLIYFVLHPPIGTLLLALFFGPIIHVLMNILLWAIGVRKEKF